MIQKILFVEDDSQNRLVYSELLRKRGYLVSEAKDGAEAVELLEKQIFDIVISDLVLPKLHGLNLVYEIRARWPTLPDHCYLRIPFRQRWKDHFGGRGRVHSETD